VIVISISKLIAIIGKALAVVAEVVAFIVASRKRKKKKLVV